VARIRPAPARVRDSRIDKPIVRVSQTARRIAPDNPTVLRIAAQRLVQDSLMLRRIARANRMRRIIAAQRLARDSRTTVLTIAARRLVQDSLLLRRIVRANRMRRIIAAQLLAQVNRTHLKIVAQHLVPDSRATIVRDSRTTSVPDSRTAHAPALPKTGTCHAPVLRTMPLRTMPVLIMAPATMLPIARTMLLGPALPTIGLLLRRTAMLLATTVVPGNRFHVHLLQIGQIRPRSSNLVNIQAHGRRTTARRNRHKRGPGIVVLRKLRR
jgi:hypothetical protein